ncbi:MAG: HAD hydrolase-like protein [Woeseiaceae bacterium]|nr:HAD hydrolase-like protein [Woeseiaceae bacterium]
MTAARVKQRLGAARGFLFDLDGTLVLGNKQNKDLECLPGAADVLQLLASRNVPVAVLTNGTVCPPAEYRVKLATVGLDLPVQRIMTPAVVAADYFTQRGFKTVLVLGVDGVWKPLRDAGLEVIRPAEGGDPESADAVFVGWYREIHMDEVEAACHAVCNGAGLFAASLVPFFATRSGRALGTSRAICAMITSITGRRATALGKPSPHALHSAARRLGCKPADMVVVGDQPELEVRMALEGGALGIAVSSGIVDPETAKKYKADITLPGVADLLELLR